MDKILPLDPIKVHHKCDHQDLPFKNTSTLEKFRGFFGQDRALQAMRFGIEMKRPGYNLFVMGNPHTGRFSFALDHLKSVAKKEKKPLDWCYFNNFEDPRAAISISLVAGKAVKLKTMNSRFVQALASELPAAYESPSFQRRKTKIEKGFNALYDAAIDHVEECAREHSLAVYRDAGTVGFTPVADGQAMDEAQFSSLSDAERQVFTQNISRFEDLLNEQLSSLPLWRRDAAEKLRLLEKETAIQVVEPLIADIKQAFADSTQVIEYFDSALGHLSRHAQDFLNDETSGELLPEAIRRTLLQAYYGISVLVDNSKTKGAAVIYEPHPTYENLFGRMESPVEAVPTNSCHLNIIAGALHKANGGYLLLDAEKLLELPHVYAALKRALKGQEVRIEQLSSEHQMGGGASQAPTPIKLDLKVVLVGARNTYYLLQSVDPDFEKTFRVVVDFEEEVSRNSESVRNYCRLMKTICDQEGLADLSRAGAARLVEHSSRLAGDQQLLSSHIGNLVDLLCEADYKRAEVDDQLIAQSHINLALDAQRVRAGRLQESILKGILNEQILIDTAGFQVGKCNGLTVLQVGDFAFGTPARITATVFPGKQGVVDIERESDLGRSIHSKGVLILSGYLGNKYAKEFALHISANIALEQSYGEIDGDSASLAEVCSLISSLVQVPLSQSFAITGSINQYGEVQAIGGVNEKIEGFYDLCQARQSEGQVNGVIIPHANVRNLMLNPNVVTAITEKKFFVYAVTTVDQCLSLLTSADMANASSTVEAVKALDDKVIKQLRQFSELAK